jgi:hypothetical protein
VRLLNVRLLNVRLLDVRLLLQLPARPRFRCVIGMPGSAAY